MEQLGQTMERLLNLTRQNSLPLEPQTYECESCQDTEWILNPDTNAASPCKCRQAKYYKRIYENAGISKAFADKSFDNFTTQNKPAVIKAAKEIAQKFASGFNFDRSLALLGQVGAGKTHLCIAVLNQLLKRNIAVLYMQYREAITQLKQCITDEENYKRELGKYRTAPVLYIDDLYKGVLKNTMPNESEIRIMFEIINYRYLNNLPIIVSSEYGIEKLIYFDEAVGSRIIEMCKGFVIEFEGSQLNHRLWG